MSSKRPRLGRVRAQVVCEVSELETIDLAAKVTGTDRSAFMREAALARAREMLGQEDPRELLSSILGVGAVMALAKAAAAPGFRKRLDAALAALGVSDVG